MKTYLFLLKLTLFNFLLLPLIGFSQVSELSNTPFAATDYLGWDNSSTQALTIKNEANQPINFYTTAGAGTLNNLRMTILGGGNVGIGSATPVQLLDVNGNVNIATTQWYGINNARTLAVPNTTSLVVGWGAGTNLNANTTHNTFVGINAGTATTTVSLSHGLDNTFVGHNAGTANTSALDNTFVGSGSGVSNTIGNNNTLVGSGAGATVSTNGNNTFVGYQAGNLNTAANNNFFGFRAGLNNASGTTNNFFGTSAGQSNTTSNNNSFFGHVSGQNSTGGDNSFFGSNCGNGNTTGTGNTFVGFNAGFQLTTGDNNVSMGINAGRDLTISAANDNNVIIGANAGFGNSTATGGTLTLVGCNTDASNSLTNAGAIGANATVTTSNSLILGAITGTNGGTSINVGIGTTAPVQRLHVEGTARITGSDGIATTVMGRDADGDISILGLGTGLSITSGTLNYSGPSSGTITACSSPTPANNYVTKWTNAPTQICNSIIYDDGIRVGISSASPTGKLNVVNSSEAITGNYNCTNAGMTDIIKAVYNQTSTGSIDGIEVSITSTGTGTYTNVGVRSSVTSSSTNQTNMGVYGYGAGDGNTKNYGGYFEGYSNAVAATTNYGVYAKATGGVNNYGIYAVATGTQSVTNCAGYFSGDAHSSTGFYGPSDETLKQNIQPFTNGLSILAQLNPKSFEFRTSEYPQMNLPENTSYGLIAQELQSVIPSLVDSFVHPVELDSNGVQFSPEVSFIGVNYAGLVPFLIAAIKEQQQQITDLNSRLTSCCGPGIQEFQVPDNGYNQPSTINHQELVSVARDLPVLSQNQPNPFSEKTLIRFYIPKTTKDAAIKVFDNTGSVYRLFALTGEGPGTIEIEANTLTSGNYYYSLLIGGNVIDTKTMVITK